MNGFGLPDETRISRVQLRTKDLERALSFYCDLLGLKIVKQKGSQVSLSPNSREPVMIMLTEDKSAESRADRTIGLYHFAIRYASRPALARALNQLVQKDYPVEGASDHIVSEALYLSDPENNGVELYCDRPRSEWVWRNGQIAMATRALDLESLLKTADHQTKSEQTPAEIDLGHLHFHVVDLGEAERFYHDFLGMEVTQRSYPGALFFSAGGYHHHIAANTWAGKAKPPENSVGLVSYRLEVPVKQILSDLHHRAPLAGYQVDRESTAPDKDLLRIRDPNGAWLEIGHSGGNRATREKRGALNQRS